MGVAESTLTREAAAVLEDASLHDRSDTGARMARLAELEAELKMLAAQITSTQARFCATLSAYDALEGWAQWGARSPVEWLSNHCGHGGALAAKEVALAHALGRLPRVRAAMETGELSLDKAAAVATVAVADTEEELLTFACHATANQLNRAMAAARRALSGDDAQRLRRARYLDTWWDGYGLLQVKGQLSPEEGALFRKALEAARETLYKERRSEGFEGEVPPEGEPDDPSPDPAADADDPPGARRADALMAMARSYLATSPVAQGAENYLVVVHTDESVLVEGGEGRCHLEEGPALSADTVRRLACGASLVFLVCDGEGNPVAVSEKTSDIPTWLRRKVRARDRGCVFPTGSGGRCGAAPEHSHVHHVIYRSRGGPHTMANCWTLCRHHHHLVHEGGFTITRAQDESLEFRRPDGTVIPTGAPPPPSRGPEPPATQGLHPNGSWALSNGERMDLGLTVDGLIGVIAGPEGYRPHPRPPGDGDAGAGPPDGAEQTGPAG